LNSFFLLLCTNTELGTKHKICYNESLYAGVSTKPFWNFFKNREWKLVHWIWAVSSSRSSASPCMFCWEKGDLSPNSLVQIQEFRSFRLNKDRNTSQKCGSTVAIANRLEQGNFKHYEMGPLLKPCKNSKSNSFFILGLDPLFRWLATLKA
jgi:hypothetical protein